MKLDTMSLRQLRTAVEEADRRSSAPVPDGAVVLLGAPRVVPGDFSGEPRFAPAPWVGLDTGLVLSLLGRLLEWETYERVVRRMTAGPR